MKKNIITPWYAQSRCFEPKRPTSCPAPARFTDFDEVFAFIFEYFGDKYDIRFSLVFGRCPMSSAVFADPQPFISIDMDMRFPIEYCQATYTIAIPTAYGGYSRGRFVCPRDYHTEFYLLPRFSSKDV